MRGGDRGDGLVGAAVVDEEDFPAVLASDLVEDRGDAFDEWPDGILLVLYRDDDGKQRPLAPRLLRWGEGRRPGLRLGEFARLVGHFASPLRETLGANGLREVYQWTCL